MKDIKKSSKQFKNNCNYFLDTGVGFNISTEEGKEPMPIVDIVTSQNENAEAVQTQTEQYDFIETKIHEAKAKIEEIYFGDDERNPKLVEAEGLLKQALSIIEEENWKAQAAKEKSELMPGVITSLEGLDSRADIIKAIKNNLKIRSGKEWSVTGGKGTAYGWISISAPPKRLIEFGYMSDEDKAELGRLLGKENPSHCQGENIPSSSAYRLEYLQRSAGMKPEVIGQPYWD